MNAKEKIADNVLKTLSNQNIFTCQCATTLTILCLLMSNICWGFFNLYLLVLKLSRCM